MDNIVFQDIVEGAPDPIIIQSKGRFEYLNPAACRLFGVNSKEELTGTPLLEFIHIDFTDVVREWTGLIEEGNVPGRNLPEIKINRLRGNEEIWIEVSGKPITYNGYKAGLFFIRDITIRRQSEIALRASEEKFRNVFQNHGAVKLIINTDDGKIIEANDAASRFYGWTVEELKNLNISQINTLSLEDLNKEIKRAKVAVNTRFNFKHRTAGGTIKDVEVYSSHITIDGRDFLHSIIHDVTEKKIAEKQLKLLSRSVEQSPVSIIITDTVGNIEYVNPAFISTTGYSFEEVKGKNPRILKSGYQSANFYKYMWDTILSGKDWSGEFRNKKKNGQLFWERTTISPITDSRGQVTSFVSIREDITARKKMVEDLVAAKEKAEENDRLKLAFLANMSHEMRTPMNGILGFAEILKSPGLSGKQQRKYIDIIQKSGNRMLETVNDLIDISKIETGQVKMYITEINLNEQLENHYDFFQPQAEEKQLKLILKDKVPPGFEIMRTDRTKLDSILTNLIRNAIKFTDEGKIEIGCIPTEGFLEYYVRDTGIGVPKKRQKAIFNRFEQADIADAKAFQGSGLGLTISKSYVEMLGGSIRVESETGKGSAFYFTVPVNIPEVKFKDKFPAAGRQMNGIPTLKGRKILITDDDMYSREMIVLLLEKTGANLLTAADGAEAINIFSQQRDIDLVLLDIQLPKVNGYDVLKELRLVNPAAVIIAQTAYAMLEDIKKFKDAGFTDYLTKPIRQKKLFGLLSRYLA